MNNYGNRGWIIVGVVVLAIEKHAPEGELLSEAFDRFRTRHPVLAYLLVLATAAHLLRRVPSRFDVYSGFGYPILRKLKGH